MYRARENGRSDRSNSIALLSLRTRARRGRQGQIAATARRILLVCSVIVPLVFTALNQGDAAASIRSKNLLTYCAGPIQLQPGQSLSSSGERVEAVAIYTKGTAHQQAVNYAENKFAFAVEKCFGFSEITSADGTLVLTVFGSPSAIRHYRSFIISYLKRSGMFSLVKAHGPPQGPPLS
jgi:hypothetical protein